MLDKRTTKLLKHLYKKDTMTYAEIDKLLKTTTPENAVNSESMHLSQKGLILRHYVGQNDEGSSIYDGYTISIDGRAYIEDKRKTFLAFVLPYSITTLIALLSLFTTLALNWEKITDLFSTIAQMLH